MGLPADAGRPHGRPFLAGGDAGGGRRRPGERPPSRHQVEPDPPACGGGRAARWRPGLQHPAGEARLAGRAGEAAATGRAGLHQRARSEAPRAEPAGERGARPGHVRTGGGRHRPCRNRRALAASQRQVLHHRRLPARGAAADDLPGHHSPRGPGGKPESRGPGSGRRDRNLLDGEALHPQGSFAGVGQLDRLARADRRGRTPAIHLRGGRHHRAEACRRGTSHERGSPGGGRRPRRPRVLRGGLRRTHRLHRRPVSRPLRCSPGTGGGRRALGVLDRASAP